MTRIGNRQFHQNAFDEETLLKLRIFRQYVREWLPVFLSKGTYPQANIFDFFAGPGGDPCGNPGSPVIILDEVARYLADRPVDSRVSLALYFNDKEKAHTEQLGRELETFRHRLPCNLTIDNLDFDKAFEKCLPCMSADQSANLIILDQFGFKHMPPDVFQKLVLCGATDLMCFITSSYVKRFVGEETTRRYIPIKPEELASIPASSVHRHICDYYRRCVPAGREYYVAPFSIKNQSNVYGLIFGSGRLLGLEKFLKVCWGLDEFTGEANFAIDSDAIADGSGQRSLFPEDNIPKKQREFIASFINYISEEGRTNRDIYRFTLESGFLPRHANDLLKTLHTAGKLRVEGAGIRRGSYYVSWECYKEMVPKVSISYRGNVI